MKITVDLSGGSPLPEPIAFAEAVARRVLPRAKVRTPRKTGRLRRSGRIVRTARGVRILYDASKGGRESYAGFVHDGTRKMRARPYLHYAGRTLTDADMESVAKSLSAGSLLSASFTSDL